RIQLVRAEIMVHMPNAHAVVVGDAARERRSQVGQTDRGQPAFDRQFDSPRGRGTEAFGDQSARLAGDGELEAEHAQGLLLQLGVAEEPSLRGGTAEQFLQQSAEFWDARLTATVEELVETFNHRRHLAMAGSPASRDQPSGSASADENRQERLAPDMVEKDFSEMAARGFNVVRVYTAPPPWLLDAALKHGLRVMIGLNWGEHMAFLDEPRRVEEIEERIRTWIRSCAGHPAV